MDWDEDRLEYIRQQRLRKVTYKEIAKHFGVTRNCIAGAINRHLTSLQQRRPRDLAKVNTVPLTQHRVAWSEQALTETWAARKLRRAREKELELGRAKTAVGTEHPDK